MEGVLRDSRGADWFERSVPERMRKEAARKQKEEGAARFHGHRGPDLPVYLGVSDWMKVIEENWGDFEPVLFQSHWSLGKLQELRLTRNSVAHMGEVTDDDIARLDLLIRDWNRQTGQIADLLPSRLAHTAGTLRECRKSLQRPSHLRAVTTLESFMDHIWQEIGPARRERAREVER